jgi:hypothetical protein
LAGAARSSSITTPAAISIHRLELVKEALMPPMSMGTSG